MRTTSDTKRRLPRLTAAAAAAAMGAALLAALAAPAQAAESPGDHFDYNGDGFQDLYTVRKSDGQLLFFAGNGTETLTTPAVKGTGWGKMDIVMAGDLTEDGTPDLLARDFKTGSLYTYPGDGTGGLEPRILVGSGWNSLVAFSAGADFDGDGHLDLYAISRSDGELYRYPGLGDGKFATRSLVAVGGAGNEMGEGWAVFDSMTTVDTASGLTLLLHSSSSGYYMSLETDGDGGFGEYPYYVAGSMMSSDDPTQYLQLVAAGDRNEDGRQDYVAVERQSGALVLLKGNAYGSVGSKTRLASAGTVYELPATTFDGTYDFDRDYDADLYAVTKATATDLAFYPGTGTGRFGPREQRYFLIDDMTLVESAGDMDGDMFPDLLIRQADGHLHMMSGNNDINAPQHGADIGYGWNSMSAIAGGHDFNADGKTDVLAREKSTGYLWLYPGTGEGGLGTRVKIGTGWNSMREITAAGDLDHDGFADLLAIRSSDDCMYFYGGRGDRTFKSGVSMGCGWSGYDAVAAVGDFSGDGHADWLARRKSDGALFLYRGNGSGGIGSRVQIGTGWNSIKFIA
jgi:hypothetical protein